MPIHRPARCARAVLVVLAAVFALAGCGAVANGPIGGGGPSTEPRAEADPAAGAPSTDHRPGGPSAPAGGGAHEISIVADFGPLPDGSGDAVVETTWTVDAHGTRRLVVDTPSGVAEHHVMTDDEHWWWLGPEVRATIVDAEWIHFDLAAIEDVGGELPEVVAEARSVVPPPPDIVPGHLLAGRQVLAAHVVSDDEVQLVVDGVERPVVHRRRLLPEGTTIELPTGAVDVRDVPGVLRR